MSTVFYVTVSWESTQSEICPEKRMPARQKLCSYVYINLITKWIVDDVIYTVSQKKQDTKLLPITLPNIGRFSKIFHC